MNDILMLELSNLMPHAEEKEAHFEGFMPLLLCFALRTRRGQVSSVSAY